MEVDRSAYMLIAFWVAMLSLAVASIDLVYVPFMQRDTLNGVDDYLTALSAITLATLWLSSQYRPRQLLDTIALTIVAGSVASSFFALAGLWVDTKPVGYYFWAGVDADGSLQTNSVAVGALSNGRVTGIFNQPAEAGICYSLGAFAVVYMLSRSRTLAARITLLLSLAVITVGGFMSISKVFILIGLPAAVIQLLRTRVAVNKLLFIVLSPPLAVLFVIRPLAGKWSGASRLAMFFDRLEARPNGTVSTVTSGRWGNNTQGGIAPAFSEAMHISPWFGLGSGGTVGTPYDSVWLEVVIVGGLIGLGLTMCIMVAILARLFSKRPARPPEVQALGLSLVILVVLGSFGMTVLTANRTAVCLWLLLVPTLFARWPGVEAAPGTKGKLIGGAPREVLDRQRLLNGVQGIAGSDRQGTGSAVGG